MSRLPNRVCPWRPHLSSLERTDSQLRCNHPGLLGRRSPPPQDLVTLDFAEPALHGDFEDTLTRVSGRMPELHCAKIRGWWEIYRPPVPTIVILRYGSTER
jgi:hypothetical protein